MTRMDWVLPEETWKGMNPEEQLHHCISVRAYFLSQEREKAGIPGSPENDWHEAEQEEIRWSEALECRCQMRKAAHPDDKARYAVLYHVSNELHIRPQHITDATPLPTGKEVLRRLGDIVGFESGRGGGFQIPENATTVGEFLEAVRKAPLAPKTPLKW